MDSLAKKAQEIEERESKPLDLPLEKKISQDIFDKKREELVLDKSKANSKGSCIKMLIKALKIR
jgi:hypothetical protein